MVDLPKLTPSDKDKMPVSIDAKHIHLVHTPWFVKNTIDKVKAGSTPSPSAVGADNWAIQDKDIVVEDDWLKTKPCPYISKMSKITVSSSITFTGAIEFTLFDYSKPTLKEAEVKRVSTLAVQTVNVLVKNQVAYIIMDAKGVLSVESTLPIGVLYIQSYLENQKFLISTVLKDNSDNIINANHLQTPAHPTHKHFPGQLNWLLTKIGVWQRNIIPEIIGTRGQAGTQFMRAADAHGAFIGGVTRNPRPDDLSGNGFSHIAIPVKVAANAFVSVVSRDDHKTYASQKGMPNIAAVKRYGNNQAISTGNMVLHPIFVKPRNYYVNYNNPVELEFIIVITDNPGVPITGGVKPWMLEKSLSDTVVQPSVRDFAALCGFLIVKENDIDIIDTNIITANQNFSAVNKHITPMPVVQADALPIAVVVNDKVELSGLSLLENGVMPYVSALKGIKYGYIPRNPMKKAVLSYRSSTNTWTLKPINYTLSQTQINDFLTTSGVHGFVTLQASNYWLNCSVGAEFKGTYDFLAKIFNVSTYSDIKFTRQNTYIKYRADNSKIDYIYNSNACNNFSAEPLVLTLPRFPNLPRPPYLYQGALGGYIWHNSKYGFTAYDYSGHFVDETTRANLLPRINVFPGFTKYNNIHNALHASGAMPHFAGGASYRQNNTPLIDNKQFKNKTPELFIYNNTNLEIKFLDDLPQSAATNDIDIDITKTITTNQSYLNRLNASAIPPIATIACLIATQTAGAKHITFPTQSAAGLNIGSVNTPYRTMIYGFGAGTTSTLTPITGGDLQLDITLEALL